ncbi:hypothetical protein M758_1G057600 [Ceratodon purpureus]|uniref:Uncharacterized protein n=1 Tax=Ceratodon purpureus TaxID=3225 RepID=A0A8T0J553_CERPU|nr:hypothetical protein KC19_1G059300 [Ceratodon purpureus]KAG0628863.1 hypothetical protein M758_1G057600 [Ceratodon purpureus]
MWGCSSGESGKFIAEGRERIGSMAMWSRAVIVALLSCALLFPSLLMAAEEDQPKDFEYFQIWVSQDGETHIAECKMKGFNYTAYSSLPQYLRSDFGGEPVKFVLTELPVGLAQPLHNTPIVQFVATLSGSWYIETTDGTRRNLKKGQLLFQDNTANSPADKSPQHYSGTHGDKPCHQLIIQLSRPPQVDNPCPF